MTSAPSPLIPVAACSPHVYLADPPANAEELARNAKEAAQAGARLVVFPELSLTGVTCADLFLQPLLIQSAEKTLLKLASKTKALDAVLVVGLPLMIEERLYNVAAVLAKGEVKGIVPKVYGKLQSGAFGVFEKKGNFKISAQLLAHELRWFSDGSQLKTTIELGGRKVPVNPAFALKNPFGRAAGRSAFQSLPKELRVVVGNAPFLGAFYPGTRGSAKDLLEAASKGNKSAILIANPMATPAVAAPLTPEKCVQACIAVENLAVVRAGAGEGESTTDHVFNGVCYLREKEGYPLVFSETGWFMGGRAEGPHKASHKAANKTAGKAARKAAKRVAACQLLSVRKQTRADAAEPFLTADKECADAICDEAFAIQVAGLKQRLLATGIKKLVVGVSGGLDSTLAMLVSARVLKELHLSAKNLIAISMPGFGTTKITKSNAELLAKALGATYKEISIAAAVRQHFKDIGHRMSDHNSAFENAQARERTQILMDVANDVGALVVGTGDMSEAALGWATFNGDHMSMYNVNGGVPKTMVRALVEKTARETSGALGKATEKSDATLARVLLDIVETPISPELLPPKKGRIQQQTEDLIGPYELHDFFLYHFLRDRQAPKEIFKLAKRAFPKVAPKTIARWERVFFARFFSQQFKRNCSVDGPRVTEISLSPRGGFEMASDACVSLWLKECDSLCKRL